MSTFVLVHGAWHGGWCWNNVVPALRREGHHVYAPNLPGHGEDDAVRGSITLQMYTERILELLDRQQEPVILVGHSMGGLVVSEAAERRPDKVRTLMYVCAFLLRNGQTLGEVAQRDPNALVMPNLVASEDGLTVRLKENIIRDAFYTCCTPEDAAFARARLVPQAVAPFATPLQLSEVNYGSIPRVYVECTRDRAISIEIQREMCTRTPCARTYTLDTDHSPFLSSPVELTALLHREG
jgi:pimeloyl-ACP methyl ester carboxylesterase